MTWEEKVLKRLLSSRYPTMSGPNDVLYMRYIDAGNWYNKYLKDKEAVMAWVDRGLGSDASHWRKIKNERMRKTVLLAFELLPRE